jgi:hypothetical protein
MRKSACSNPPIVQLCSPIILEVGIHNPLHGALKAREIIHSDFNGTTLSFLAWIKRTFVHFLDTPATEDPKGSICGSSDSSHEMTPTAKENQVFEDKTTEAVGVACNEVDNVVYFEVPFT